MKSLAFLYKYASASQPLHSHRLTPLQPPRCVYCILRGFATLPCPVALRLSEICVAATTYFLYFYSLSYLGAAQQKATLDALGVIRIVCIAAPPPLSFPCSTLFYYTHHRTRNDHITHATRTFYTLNRCITSYLFFHNSHFPFKLDLSYTRTSGRSRRVSQAGAA